MQDVEGGAVAGQSAPERASRPRKRIDLAKRCSVFIRRARRPLMFFAGLIGSLVMSMVGTSCPRPALVLNPQTHHRTEGRSCSELACNATSPDRQSCKPSFEELEGSTAFPRFPQRQGA